MKLLVLLSVALLTSCSMTPEEKAAFTHALNNYNQQQSAYNFQQQQNDYSFRQSFNDSTRNIQRAASTQYYPSFQNSLTPRNAKVYGHGLSGIRNMSPTYSIEY